MGASEADATVLRKLFPALGRRIGGRTCVFADAPGGTQVPDAVIGAMSSYLATSNANVGGAFSTSEETAGVITEARRSGADFLGCHENEVVFGPNTTTVAWHLSRSLAHQIEAGDEIIVTRLDHDANIAPWLVLAGERGATIRWVDFDPSDCSLDLSSLEEALGERTRIVAFTLASNACGTVTNATEIVRLARATDAVLVADAVHFAQHRSIDTQALDVDVLFTSPYKYFGPHLGVVYVRASLLAKWEPYKVRPAHDENPSRWEPGTQNHEALAGLRAAVDYLADVGREFGQPAGSARRDAIVAGMRAIQEYEERLTVRWLKGLAGLQDASLYGIADPARAAERTPTFAVRWGREDPRSTAQRLGDAGIFVWDGNYYALALMERLGLEESGGAVRVGFCHYNTLAEVDRVIAELSSGAGVRNENGKPPKKLSRDTEPGKGGAHA